PKETSFQERFLQTLIQKRDGISMLLLLVGGALALLGLWLRFSHENTADDPAPPFPIWVGPILFGLVGIGMGQYPRVTPQMDRAQARIVVRLTGGLTGLILTLMTICQAWIWRNIFFGGLPAWRGPLAWQMWVCAYLAFAGLVLMFASFMLARADIRVNPVLRRSLYGYNAILTGLLLLIFLVVLNIVVFTALPLTLNWSEKGGLYSLSP